MKIVVLLTKKKKRNKKKKIELNKMIETEVTI